MASYIRRVCVWLAVLVGLSAGGLSSAMPAPPSYLDITVPYTRVITQAEFNGGTFGGTANAVWFRFVTGSRVAFGLHSNTGGTLGLQFQIYASDGTTLISGSPYRARWYPLDAATYYIKCSNVSTGVSDFNFTVDFDTLPINPAITPHTVIINDDTNLALGVTTRPASLVDIATGDTVGFVDAVPNGESGDILPSGIALWSDRYSVSGDQLVLLDASLAVIATLTPSTPLQDAPNTSLPIITNDGTQFYVLDADTGKIHTVTAAGTLTNNVADLGTSVDYGAGVSRDGTILYYAPGSTTIKRWDLSGDVALSDLATIAGADWIAFTDQNNNHGNLLVLADGTLVTNYKDTGTTHIIHLAANGTTINDWSFSDATYAINRLSYVNFSSNSTEIYVWLFGVANTGDTGTVRKIDLTTGVFDTPIITTDLFSSGINLSMQGGVETDQMFGPSNSCAMITFAPALGTINVTKATVPAASTQSFDFTAGGGLTPTTFDLLDGETQTFTDVAAGDGYTIAEAPVTGWSVSYTVSNGSSPDNIAVASGETVTVTVTNTQTPDPIPPPEGNDCCAANGPGGGSGGSGGGYPPGTDPPRVVPPGGAPPEYITCNAGGGLPAFVANPADTQNLETCTIPRVHLKWTLRDASVRRWGQYDFTSSNGFAVTTRVLKWGPVRQVLADRFGSFQVNHFTIRLSDYDRAIRTILTTTATKYIDGTEIEILIENAESAAAPLVLARAVVTDYALNSDLTVDITCTDPLGYQYSNVSLDRLTPRRVFRTELFPLLPEESSGKAVPIVYGEYSDDILWLLKSTRIPVGILPIHYVGKPSSIPGLEGAPGDHAFAICGHALSCVQSVFASNLGKDVDGVTDAPYGSVRMPTSLFGSEFFVPGIDVPLYYDLTGTDGITERFSFLFVKEGPRVKDHLNGRVPITINVLGIEDVGDGTGNTITSLTYQFLHYLCQWVLQDYRTGAWLPVPTFGDGTPKARTSSFQFAAGVQEARIGEPYVGSLYLGEQKAAREWNKAWQLSGDLRLGVNHQGQLLVTTLQDTASTSGLDTFTDTDHVFEESFAVDPKPEEIANIFTYEAGPEAATRRVSLPAVTIRNPTSITNHDEREAQALTYEATRHQTTANDVANRTLVRSADAPTDVSFTVNLRGAHLKLGQLRRLTHYQGIGPLGWTSRVLMVTGVTTTPDTDAFDCAIECEDVHDILAAGEQVMVIDTGVIGVARIG